MNKSVKKYLRRVRGWLPCTRRMKNDIMARIEDSLLSWAQENPNCDYPDIEARFGKPEKIAADYVDNLGTAELLKNLHIKKKIVTVVTAVAVTIALIWAIGVTVATVDHMIETHNRRIVTTVTVHDD